MTGAEYRHAIESLPFGKRLPGAVYLLDPADDSRVPALLRITVAELRRRMDIGAEFNLLKPHTASPKISFLAYPGFETDPHPPLAEAVIHLDHNAKTPVLSEIPNPNGVKHNSPGQRPGSRNRK